MSEQTISLLTIVGPVIASLVAVFVSTLITNATHGVRIRRLEEDDRARDHRDARLVERIDALSVQIAETRIDLARTREDINRLTKGLSNAHPS